MSIPQTKKKISTNGCSQRIKSLIEQYSEYIQQVRMVNDQLYLKNIHGAQFMSWVDMHDIFDNNGKFCRFWDACRYINPPPKQVLMQRQRQRTLQILLHVSKDFDEDLLHDVMDIIDFE